MALPLEFRDICRACMKRRDDMKMFFFSRINSVNVASMLTKIALLPVEPSDSLPKVLCSICIKKLNDAYNFQQMCIKSHISFNDMLQTQHLNKRQSEEVLIKKEIFDLDSEVGDSEVPTLGTDKCAIDCEKVLKIPKIESDIEDTSQRAKHDAFKFSKSSKTFTCNFCQDIFETWNELTVHIAEHKVKNNGTALGDGNSEVPQKKRKMSELSTTKDTNGTELSSRLRTLDYNGRGENTSSLDGLPLEPICNVQVKDEIVSDQSSCDEYDEEPHHNTYNNSQSIQNDDDLYVNKDDSLNLIHNKEKPTSINKTGQNFTDSKSPVCEMCGFKPKIPALMHAHVRNRHPDNYLEYVENLKVSGEWVVKCRICDVYLFSSTIYGQHLKYTHSQIVNDCRGYFECNHCDQTFNSKNEFFLHKNQAHNMRRINKAKQLFICLLCDKQFGRYQNLQQHEETHEVNGTSAMAIGSGGDSVVPGSVSRVSSVSGSSVGFIPLLSGFLRKKRMEPSPPAEEIVETPAFVPYPKTSPPKKYSNSNITTSAGGKFKCKGCNKSFATEFGLRVHIGCVHKGMEKLPPKKSNANANVSNAASPPLPQPQFQKQLALPSPSITTENIDFCEICDKQFDSVVDCSAHMQKHHEIAYTYREANESTAPPRVTTPNSISKMSKVSGKDLIPKLNQNGKPIKYKCKPCSTFYPDKTSLMKHTLVVHKKADGRKQFNCKVCFRTITGAQNYNSHMNRHKGEIQKSTPKNHACHLCSDTFVEQEKLQTHLVAAHSFNPMIFYKK